MSFLPRLMIALGATLISVAIALSAWHAHGLVESLGKFAYASFGRGIHQQIYAGMGLLLCAVLFQIQGSKLVAIVAAGLFVAAILFCGDVYLGALSGENLGVAPFGGSLSILSWLLLGISQLFPGAKCSTRVPA